MPSKSKKRKTNHHHHSKQKSENVEVSQSEIWDDSALVRSWEDAVKEYEYYHSLAARGIDPEEVLDEAEEAESRGKEIDLKLDGPKLSGGMNGAGDGDVEGGEGEAEDGEVEEGEVDEESVARGEGQRVTNGTSARNDVHGKQHGPPLPPDRGAEQVPPHHVNATTTEGPMHAVATADQTLENLKMAYYWAGYYSGLYDGQRQAAGARVDGSALDGGKIG